MSQDIKRLIDSDTRTRTKPMKVLVLGMCRTGTMSMHAALQKLGYTPYHMIDIMKNGSQFYLWSEALRAKYKGEGKAWGRREFDAIVGDYDAVCDVPCAFFVDELVAAYPDAKVILTHRSAESWLKSMHNGPGLVSTWSWNWVASWDATTMRPWWAFVQIVDKDVVGDWTFEPGSKAHAFYDEHNQHVRQVVKKENLLEFEAKDGWGPICEFLQLPQPDGTYPRINDGANFKWHLSIMWYICVVKMVTKISAMTALPVLTAAWYWKSSGGKIFGY